MPIFRHAEITQRDDRAGRIRAQADSATLQVKPCTRKGAIRVLPL